MTFRMAVRLFCSLNYMKVSYLKMNKYSVKRMVCASLMLFSLAAVETFAQRYQVAACDWMMLKRQKLGEFQLARDIGADGVEVDMGPLGTRVLFENKLREEPDRSIFRRTADSLGVKVPSMAMSGFFAQNLLKRDNYRDLISDCLQTMQHMGATVAFLPLGGSGHDWECPDSAAYAQMADRLHDIGQMAAAQGLTVGIRTAMGAAFDVAFLRRIDSPGIKVYYNLQDAVDGGRDVCRELELLGPDRICQIHASLTDSVTLDRDPRIDLPAVRRTLDGMGWSGWLVVERSRDVSKVRDVRWNFSANVRYLKEVFKEEK